MTLKGPGRDREKRRSKAIRSVSAVVCVAIFVMSLPDCRALRKIEASRVDEGVA